MNGTPSGIPVDRFLHCSREIGRLVMAFQDFTTGTKDKVVASIGLAPRVYEEFLTMALTVEHMRKPVVINDGVFDFGGVLFKRETPKSNPDLPIAYPYTRSILMANCPYCDLAEEVFKNEISNKVMCNRCGKDYALKSLEITSQANHARIFTEE